MPTRRTRRCSTSSAAATRTSSRPPALAHDLGHPPFGHLGEQVLDRLARHRFGLPDGFEGNAQSLRIVTTTDTGGPSAVGLDLTAAVRAAMLKYPWTRLTHPDPHPRHMPAPPRGASEPPDEPGTGSSKFSVYVTELDDMAQARAPFAGRLASWQQTVEASVMDTADDIAYAIHDLEDFHRIGVLQHAPVAAELGHWLAKRARAGRARRRACSPRTRAGPATRSNSCAAACTAGTPGSSTTTRSSPPSPRVRAELVDGLLDTPFDGSVEAEQAVGAVLRRSGPCGWSTA